MIAAIKPSEIAEAKAKTFPNFVMKTWNEMIAKKMGATSAHITQDEIVKALIEASPEMIDRSTVFDNMWLDVEDIYRAAGWKVDYDKPGYNESYGAYFKFSVAK